MVDLEEGTTRVGTDGSESTDRPPECSGETFTLSCGPIPKPGASANVTAAHRQRLVQVASQRGHPSYLQVCVRFDSEGHFKAKLL